MTVESYVIRLAKPEDVAQLPSLELRAVRLFEGWSNETGMTQAALEDVSEFDELDAARRRRNLWVAALPDDATLVGFAQIDILDGEPHLDEIDVVPEHGNRGIGSRLIAVVLEWARSAGYSKVTLSTFRDVPWNRPFYERRGFRVVETGTLGPEHQQLIELERSRGLRSELRVIMEIALSHV